MMFKNSALLTQANQFLDVNGCNIPYNVHVILQFLNKEKSLLKYLLTFKGALSQPMWKGYLSGLMTKPTKWLGAHRRLRSAWALAQSNQSSLCTQWVAKDPSLLHVDSEDGGCWVFTGRICHFVGFVMLRLTYQTGAFAQSRQSLCCSLTQYKN